MEQLGLDLQYFGKQHEAAKQIIDSRKLKGVRKEEKKSKDALENEMFNRKGAEWGTGSDAKKKEEQVRQKMLKIFDHMLVEDSHRGNNAKHAILKKFYDGLPDDGKVGSMRKMGQTTFSKFISGQRSKSTPVDVANMKLFEFFI